MSLPNKTPNSQTTNATIDSSEFKGDLFKYLLPEDPNGARASAVWNDLAPHLEGILKDFYTRLNATPVLKGKLNQSTHSIENLSKLQTGHWQRVFNSKDEGKLAEDARKIGAAHVRIGLTSDWFIAGYGRVLMQAVPTLLKAHRFTPQRAAEATQILIARMFLDMALANESYSNDTYLVPRTPWTAVSGAM